MKAKDLKWTVFLGLLNPFLYYLVLLKAYDMLKAQEAGTLNYIWPITLVLLSIPMLKQKIKWTSILAIFISFIGIIIISTEGKLSTLEFREPIGVILALVSSIFWALYWIFNLKDKRDESLKLFSNFLAGTLFSFIGVVVFSDLNLPTLKSISAAAYIGVFEMGLPFFLWLMALKYSSTTAKVSNLVYLSPFISLMIIQIVLKEQILLATIIGLVFIIGGIMIQQFTGNTKPNS
jgi:drug/metabolite transporter (DMT)-like permease